MKLNPSTLAAAALAGLFATGTALAQTQDSGSTGIAISGEKQKCSGKDKCNSKDKDKDKDKDKCNGKDGCDGKEKKEGGSIL